MIRSPGGWRHGATQASSRRCTGRPGRARRRGCDPADCIGAQFYVQDAVLCPAAVCGNAIIEPGESCDDGNTVDGDGCRPPATDSVSRQIASLWRAPLRRRRVRDYSRYEGAFRASPAWRRRRGL
jgi:cysteine-rich repeat protein